jgi:hypothetical protein
VPTAVLFTAAKTAPLPYKPPQSRLNVNPATFAMFDPHANLAETLTPEDNAFTQQGGINPYLNKVLTQQFRSNSAELMPTWLTPVARPFQQQYYWTTHQTAVAITLSSLLYRLYHFMLLGGTLPAASAMWWSVLAGLAVTLWVNSADDHRYRKTNRQFNDDHLKVAIPLGVSSVLMDAQLRHWTWQHPTHWVSRLALEPGNNPSSIRWLGYLFKRLGSQLLPLRWWLTRPFKLTPKVLEAMRQEHRTIRALYTDPIGRRRAYPVFRDYPTNTLLERLNSARLWVVDPWADRLHPKALLQSFEQPFWTGVWRMLPGHVLDTVKKIGIIYAVLSVFHTNKVYRYGLAPSSDRMLSVEQPSSWHQTQPSPLIPK